MIRKKSLVLGASGFIGSHLTACLLMEGYDVKILTRRNFFELNRTLLFDLLYSQRIIENELHLSGVGHSFISNGDASICNIQLAKNFDNKLEIQYGDFQHLETVKQCTQGIDYVFHLISSTTPSSSNQDMCFDISTNLIPSLNLLESCVKNDVAKLIFFSSGGTVYGVPECVPISELHNTNPICSYGIQKLAIENYIYMYHILYGLKSAILRLSNPYGFGQGIQKKQGFIGTLIHRLKSGKEMEIWGDGTVVRDYIYIDDVIQASIKALNYESNFCILNIGSGIGLSIIDIIHQVENIIQEKLNVVYKASRSFDVPVNILDISRASSLLTWQPDIPISEGIRKMIM
jgi:UDP-glucose 4-epimerase